MTVEAVAWQFFMDFLENLGDYECDVEGYIEAACMQVAANCVDSQRRV